MGLPRAIFSPLEAEVVHPSPYLTGSKLHRRPTLWWECFLLWLGSAASSTKRRHVRAPWAWRNFVELRSHLGIWSHQPLLKCADCMDYWDLLLWCLEKRKIIIPNGGEGWWLIPWQKKTTLNKSNLIYLHDFGEKWLHEQGQMDVGKNSRLMGRIWVRIKGIHGVLRFFSTPGPEPPHKLYRYRICCVTMKVLVEIPKPKNGSCHPAAGPHRFFLCWSPGPFVQAKNHQLFLKNTTHPQN